MLAVVSILVGLAISVSFSLWLWYMLHKPKQWALFTEKDHKFWVKRGLPIKWAGACKDFEQGSGLKLLVGLCILMALILILAAVLLPVLFPHSG